MRIETFTVNGFANFTSPVSLGGLEEINVLYGPNNAGKSNLLRALELYFRLLGVGENVLKAQPYTFEEPQGRLAELLSGAFNWKDPQPVRFSVEWRLAPKDLERAGLMVDQPIARVGTVLELKSVNRVIQLHVVSFMVDGRDAAALSKDKDGPAITFAQQIRRVLSDAAPFQFDQPVLPWAHVGAPSTEVPQELRDALFDARMAVSSEQRKRWTLFTQLASTLQQELGEGQWDTAFDRSTGKADLVYIQGERAMTLQVMGAGIQRMTSLLGELVLRKEGWVGIEEPEWRLSPTLQARFAQLVKRVIESGTGTRQVFITSHSPILAAIGAPYAMDFVDGVPTVERKPWEGAGLPAAGGDNSGDLGSLIGLVETLAEIDPSQLVGGKA